MTRLRIVSDLEVEDSDNILYYNKAGIFTAIAGSSTALTGLTDVTITSPATGQVLRKSAGGDFVNAVLAHADLGTVTSDQHHAQSHGNTDHTAAPTPSAVDIGDAAVIGTDAGPARGDHQHAVTAPTAGYPVDSIIGTEADGTATTPARSDHQHSITAPPVGYPVDVAAAEADGTSTNPARADHVHAHGTGYLANAHHNQSHVLDPGDHTISGKTAGQFLRATGATTFVFEAIPFSKGGVALDPDVRNIIIWRAPFACTVTKVWGYRVGGTGATINARLNGVSNHLASALSLTSADTWMDGGAVQNTAYVTGDKLEIMIVSVTGAPTQVAIQIDFTRP